jgi:hypothetical protein
LFLNAQLIRAMDVELAENDIDYWVVTDLTPWLVIYIKNILN